MERPWLDLTDTWPEARVGCEVIKGQFWNPPVSLEIEVEPMATTSGTRCGSESHLECEKKSSAGILVTRGCCHFWLPYTQEK